MNTSRSSQVRLLALATLAALSIAACAGGAPAKAAEAAVLAGLEGSWLLEELDGQPLPADAASPPTMTLSGGNSGGTGSCNSWGAAYVLDGPGLIRFTELWSTKMACEDMLLESMYFRALSEARAWSLSDGRLLLMDGSGTVLAAFAGAPAP